MMEGLQQRRKVATYGKSKKRVQLDYIFGDDSSCITNTREEGKVNRLGGKKRSPDGTAIETYEVETDAHGEYVRLGSPLAVENSLNVPDSSDSQSSHQGGSASSSILDILDSDEEACAQQLQPVEIKRRKVASLGDRPRPAVSGRIQKRDQTAISGVAEERKRGRTTSALKRRLNDRKTQAHRPSHQDALIPSAVDTTAQPLAGVGNASLERKTKLSATSAWESVSTSESHDEEHRIKSDRVVQRSPPKTPRAGRTLQSTDRLSKAVASPSQLGLTALRLTPDKQNLPTRPSLESGALTPRRARQKLMDSLDAPEGDNALKAHSSDVDIALAKLPGESPATKRTLLPQNLPATNDVAATYPELVKGPGPANDKSKFTYGKERSHLSDTVGQVDSLKPRQPSEQMLPLPTTLPSRASQQMIPIDDFDDDDESSATTVVKSIHELRQAGINNRFERDLESLFEDIEPQSSSSKALRIQALLQLIRKLHQPSFARQFVEVGMTQRLASCGQAHFDTVSAVLLVHALGLLFSPDHFNAQHAHTSFTAIISLSPNLLSRDMPFQTFVTGRKQNLSKALTRDLVEFAKATQIGPILGDAQWTPQHVALFALEDSLRMMKSLKTVPAELPPAIFNQILALLSTACDDSQSSGTQAQLITAALSILEFSAVSQASPEGVDDKPSLNHNVLADVMTRLMRNTTAEQTDLLSSALRLIVSLTNNEIEVCSALAATELIPTVFAVVQHEFPRLSESADRGDEFDSSKLNLVIMALGCLLNLADCSDEARARMYNPSSRDPSIVHWLVSIFNKQAGKAAEATTIAQGHISVSFGYMSMLLCTLCLTDDIYTYIAASINGKDITALCVEAEEFLDKLETVASLNPEDPATVTFYERFRSILVKLSRRSFS